MPEIDILVDIVAGVIQDKGGVRMTGGGFGGCVVALVPSELVTSVVEAVTQQYFPKTGLVAEFYPCFATSGAFV